MSGAGSPRITIHVHTEPLPPRAAGQFSVVWLTVSMFLGDLAMVPAVMPALWRDLMCPWLWLPLDGLTPGQPRSRPGFLGPDGLKWNDPWTPPAAAMTLRAALAEPHEVLLAGIYDGTVPNTDFSTSERNSARVHWPNLLTNTVRLPGMAGRALDLVYVIPDLTGVAAPVFAIRPPGTTTAILLTPRWSGSTDSVIYEPSDPAALAGLSVQATLYNPAPWTSQPAAPAAPSTEPAIDPATFWIDLHGQSGWSGRDWFTRLPMDVADAADLPRHLVEALRELFKTTDLPEPLKLALWDAFWALLGMTAGTGQCGLARVDPDSPVEPTWTSVTRQLGLPGQSPPSMTGNDPALDDALDPSLAATARDELIDALLAVASWAEPGFASTMVAHAGSTPSAMLARMDAWLSLARRRAANLLLEQVRLKDAPLKATSLEARAALLASIPLTRRLTLDHIGKLWPSLKKPQDAAARGLAAAFGSNVPSLPEPASPLAAIQRVRVTVYEFLLGNAMARLQQFLPPSGDPAPVAAVRQAFAQHLGTAISAIGETLPPEATSADGLLSPQVLGPVGNVETPQPISLVVGSLQRQAGDTDPLGRFAGVGVMVRVMKPLDASVLNSSILFTPWYCLTLGTVVAGGLSLDVGHAPLRVATQSGLDGWIVNYEGLPLTAKPILSEMVSTGLDPLRDSGWDNPPLAEVRQVRPEHVHAPADATWSSYPALGYGRLYEFAFFAQTDGGALPEAVSEPRDPCTFRMPLGSGTLMKSPGQPVDRIQVRYLRRTRISAPRLVQPRLEPRKSGDKGLSQFRAPSIPRDGDFPVYPLAEELAPAPALKGEFDRRSHDILGQLVLLHSFSKQQDNLAATIQIGIAPPRVAIEDRLRWLYGDPIGPDFRDEVAALLLAAHTPAKVLKEGDPDSSVDDPATEFFQLTFTRMWGKDEPPLATVVVAFKKPSPGPGLALWQADPVVLTVVIGHTSTWDRAGLVLSIPKGHVWSIEIATLVAASWSNNADHAGSSARLREAPTPTAPTKDVHNLKPELVSYQGAPYHKAATTRVTIETATDALPNYAQVWAAIRVLASTPDELLVGIEPPADPRRDSPFNYAKRARLTRQLWSWSGRVQDTSLAEAVRTLPALPGQSWLAETPEGGVRDPSGSWAALAEGDAEWFIDRGDTDSIEVAGWLPPPGITLANSPDSCSHRISLARDRRAQYWRFSAMIESRYAGLMPPAQRLAHGRIRSPWSRLVVKARPDQALTPPRLRFVLPLTRTIQANPATGIASLLVMLDEQWGAQGGFAERLEARVVLYESGEPNRPKLLQIGYDPIVSLRSMKLGGSFQHDAAAGADPLLEVQPTPLGLTFDYDTGRPRPVTSCFELSLKPDVFLAAHGPLTDVMAQVQFRRSLVPALTDSPISEDGNPQSFVSAWTAGEWVSFNADASLWAVSAGERLELCNVSDLRWDPAKPGVVRKAEPVTVYGTAIPAASPMMRRIFVLLTRPVKDLSGTTQSEDFLNMVELARATPEDVPPDAWFHLRARLVEVEMRSDTKGETCIWDQLFNGATKPADARAEVIRDDAEARIRRVSPPLGEAPDV